VVVRPGEPVPARHSDFGSDLQGGSQSALALFCQAPVNGADFPAKNAVDWDAERWFQIHDFIEVMRPRTSRVRVSCLDTRN